MKTFTATPSDITHEWHVVDAAGVPLGRLASVVAQLIRGKHKPTYTPHMDGGDFVVVINAEKVKLTGRKLSNKVYFAHTGYMGHERFTAARDLLAKHPDRVIEKGLASGAGPSPRICGTAGPRCACAFAATMPTMASATALEQKSCLTGTSFQPSRSSVLRRPVNRQQSPVALTSIRMTRQAGRRRSGDA